MTILNFLSGLRTNFELLATEAWWSGTIGVTRAGPQDCSTLTIGGCGFEAIVGGLNKALIWSFMLVISDLRSVRQALRF